MKKKIRYDQSTSKKDSGLRWWKGLRDENGKLMFIEYNYIHEIIFFI